MLLNQTESPTIKPAPRRWALLGYLLAALVVGGLLGEVIGQLIPRTYTATAVLQFPAASAAAPQGSSSDKPALSLLQGVVSVPQPGTSPATAIFILTSHDVVGQLIKRWKIQPDNLLRTEDTDTYFRRKFLCTAGASGELHLAYTDRAPERAKQVVATAISLLSRTVDTLSLDPAARTVKFLAKNLHESERDCAAAEAALVQFMRARGGTPPDMQLQGLNQLSTDLQHELRIADTEEAAARAKVQASTRLYTRMLASAQSNAGDTLLPALYRVVVDREDALAVLREKYTEQRPEVVQARQALDVARGSLRAEISRQTRGLQAGASPYVHDDLVAAIAGQAKIDGQRRAFADISARLAQLPAAQTHYEQLQLTLKDARTRLSLVRDEYVRAQIIAQSHGPQFVVLDPPTVPQKPNEFPPWQFALAGALLGAILVLLRSAINWSKGFMRKIGL